MTAHPAALYRERRDRFGRQADARATSGQRLSRYRALLFLLGVGLLTGAELSGGPGRLLLVGGGILAFVGFVVAVVHHRRVRKEADELRARAALNARALDRIERRWEVLPDADEEDPDPTHPYDADLAISGAGSLLALCTDVATRPGRETLRQWLLAPASPEEIEGRQEAVISLTPEIDFRQDLTLQGEGGAEPAAASVDRTLAWAEKDPWRPPDWLGAASWGLPPISVGLLAAHLGGWIGGPWWVPPLAVAWALLRSQRRELEAAITGVDARSEAIGRYAGLLDLIRRPVGEAPLLEQIRAAVEEGKHDAPGELRRLRRRVAWSEVRRNDLLHLPLQLFLLWDVHVARSLGRWRRRTGGRLRAWLDALGTLEALSALATLRFDHPDWCFPLVDPEAERIEGDSLGHPLLPGEQCVRNDVTVGPAGTFLFVTGSNMAGKSTLLRAVGVNAVLAQAGGPVCARSLRLPPLHVHTGMRVEESLSEGVSYFMAELRRVRRIVEAARRSGSDKGSSRVLYLLDEPLMGTNEAERRVAVRTILRHLLRTSAVGAVATHDLRLHTTDHLAEAAIPVHLEGTVREGEDGPVLSFDYRLRPGLATSTNALALLRAVGFGTIREVDEDDDEMPGG